MAELRGLGVPAGLLLLQLPPDQIQAAAEDQPAACPRRSPHQGGDRDRTDHHQPDAGSRAHGSTNA